MRPVLFGFLMLIPAIAVAGSRTIDNFEEGGFPLFAGPQFMTQTGLPTSSCWAGQREVTVAGNYSAELESNYVDDGLRYTGDQGFTPDPVVTTRYSFTPAVDVTKGGIYDRFAVYMYGQGESVTVSVLDGSGDVHSATALSLPGESWTEIMMHLFMPHVDLTDVRALSFSFGPPPQTGDEVYVSHIKVDNGSIHDYRCEMLEIIVPPLPDPPYFAEWQRPLPGGSFQTVEELEISFDQAISDSGPFPGEVHSFDTGGAAGPGLYSAMTMRVAPGSSIPSWSWFEMYWEFPIDLTDPQINEIPIWEQPHDKLIVFDLEVEHYALSSPTLQGTMIHPVRLEIPADVPLMLGDVVVDVAGSNGLLLWFSVADDGSGNAFPPDPIHFQLSMAGEWSEPTNPTTAPMGRGPTSVLSARPSVTGERTTLSLSAPLGSDTRIQVFDVRGRSVRSMRLPAWERAITWDGRDDAGRPLASGMYFARTMGAGSIPAARITLVR